MAMNKATFFFTGGKYGWSESYHSKKPDLTSTLAAARDLLPLRLALCAGDVRCEWIRVSDDLVRRDSMLHYVPRGDQSNVTNAAASSANPNLCILVRCDAAQPTVRRNIYMRGFPDDMEKMSGTWYDNAQWRASFTIFSRQLAFDLWAIRTKDPLVAQIPIVSAVQEEGTGIITFTTSANHNLSTNEAITLSNMTVPALRGNWQVLGTPPSNTTFQVAVRFLLQGVAVTGKVSKVAYKLEEIIKTQDLRISHRIAGRPSDQPRGRRRRTARR